MHECDRFIYVITKIQFLEKYGELIIPIKSR